MSESVLLCICNPFLTRTASSNANLARTKAALPFGPAQTKMAKVHCQFCDCWVEAVLTISTLGSTMQYIINAFLSE